MILRIHVTDKDIKNYLIDHGYTIITIRKLLIDEYGFKNTNEILKKYSPIITGGFLKIQLSYKDDKDYANMCTFMTRLLNQIKDQLENHSGSPFPCGFYLLYYYSASDGFNFSGDSTNSLVGYHIKTVYRREIMQEPCFLKYNYNKYLNELWKIKRLL